MSREMSFRSDKLQEGTKTISHKKDNISLFVYWSMHMQHHKTVIVMVSSRYKLIGSGVRGLCN